MRKTKASLWVITATLITVATLFLLPFTPKTSVHTTMVHTGELIRSTLLEGMVCYESEQPCVALKAGKVAHVYVKEGQPVKQGDLLFSMDTTAEEAALAAAISACNQHPNESVEGLEQLVAAASSQASLALKERLAELEGSIALAQIRAGADGVMGGVYAKEGELVGEMTLLGDVHGTQKAIAAAGRTSDLAGVARGASALLQSTSGQVNGLATVVRLGAPELNDATAQAMQTVFLLPTAQEALSDAAVGDKMMVELICEATSDVALIPIAAIDSQERVWVVENGRATPVSIDVSRRNEDYVAVSKEWAEKRIILMPNTRQLYAGCAVKEALK